MKKISSLSILVTLIGACTLSGCGDTEQDIVATSTSNSLTDKVKVSPDNFMAGQVNSLNKAKDVERLLKESNMNRFKELDGLSH